MASLAEPDAKTLLAGWRRGDQEARDQLLALFYPDLQRAAAALLRRERGVSMSTADLVQESMLRLIALDRIAWTDRAHFLALAATMMRRALLDHLRARRTLKREHDKVELLTGIGIGAPDYEVEALSAALDDLARIDRSRADIVEMRYFGGMEFRDIAEVLGCSESTVKRRWAAARLWLLAELTTA
ncbi:ECF-type sigma factor [Polymorphobacter fuscus]|uniref:Sigma-70 family RNA polymerase sigma factor n=1 Tax=Sandarakinorhabdus fusca TaxID=1439888 RepID=A0A7C9KWI8_9SPHN|nr:ECF-type sigma factor [Polymorphobacter fuscus]KAB7647433.1 sigma-70 family RNA polymerase sigma factor [Polymorphobacter fuscus]MQT16682.1 sigma-70 family RNA polymerase sigma factor [Polymorphobacter fuscus]NJC09333.1 RNA polymerase sigma factor (TIGR02999 family) [Polymorphobacter fuscus]